MSDVIGQTKLRAFVDSLTLDTMPKTTMLIGERGCGKSTFAGMIAKKLGLDMRDITAIDGGEELTQFAQSPTFSLYVADLDDMSNRLQNMVLKFIEEPSYSAFVLLMASSDVVALPTILGRCRRLYFEPYSRDELKRLEWLVSSPNEYVYEVCSTPGQLANASGVALLEMRDLCDTLIEKGGKATYANLMSLSNRINLKSDYDKYDFDLFMKVFELEAYKAFEKSGAEREFRLFSTVSKARRDSSGGRVAKEPFVLGFLTSFWKEAQAWN